MNIYVGNLSYDTTEDELRQAFAEYGDVASVNIITDRYSGKPRGFAFVEMSAEEEASAAISGLNGRELKGRELNINEAKPRGEKNNRSRGGRNYRNSY